MNVVVRACFWSPEEREKLSVTYVVECIYAKHETISTKEDYEPFKVPRTVITDDMVCTLWFAERMIVIVRSKSCTNSAPSLI